MVLKRILEIFCPDYVYNGLDEITEFVGTPGNAGTNYNVYKELRLELRKSYNHNRSVRKARGLAQETFPEFLVNEKADYHGVFGAVPGPAGAAAAPITNQQYSNFRRNLPDVVLKEYANYSRAHPAAADYMRFSEFYNAEHAGVVPNVGNPANVPSFLNNIVDHWNHSKVTRRVVNTVGALAILYGAIVGSMAVTKQEQKLTIVKPETTIEIPIHIPSGETTEVTGATIEMSEEAIVELGYAENGKQVKNNIEKQKTEQKRIDAEERLMKQRQKLRHERLMKAREEFYKLVNEE